MSGVGPNRPGCGYMYLLKALLISPHCLEKNTSVRYHKNSTLLANEAYLSDWEMGGDRIMALDLVGWNMVLDSDRADELSAFYEKLLGWTRFKGEEYTVLVNLEQTGTPTWLTIQQVDDYVPPVWPATLDKQQQMAHLDFHVQDVEEGVKYALSCGASISEHQYDDRWRVMIDPAGHPFCILPPIMPWM